MSVASSPYSFRKVYAARQMSISEIKPALRERAL
jgi:hypothetical protein